MPLAGIRQDGEAVAVAYTKAEFDVAAPIPGAPAAPAASEPTDPAAPPASDPSMTTPPTSAPTPPLPTEPTIFGSDISGDMVAMTRHNLKNAGILFEVPLKQIEAQQSDGAKKLFAITEAGRTELDANSEIVEAALARQRVMMTIGQLQDRLNPRRLALNASRDVADVGTAALNASVETVRRNPGPAAGAADFGLFYAGSLPFFLPLLGIPFFITRLPYFRKIARITQILVGGYFFLFAGIVPFVFRG